MVEAVQAASTPQGFVCNPSRIALDLGQVASTPQGFVCNAEPTDLRWDANLASTPQGFVCNVLNG